MCGIVGLFAKKENISAKVYSYGYPLPEIQGYEIKITDVIIKFLQLYKMVKKNACVFISGFGSNLKTLILNSRDSNFPITISSNLGKSFNNK